MSSSPAALAARIEAPAYAALRIVTGSMLTVHGLQKIFGLFTENAQPALGSQLWVGGIIELVCGALVAVGLFTRPAAFLASGMMAVAYTQFHWQLRFAGNMWLPQVNKGELAVAYCFVFLFIFARGAGVAALDGLFGKKSS